MSEIQRLTIVKNFFNLKQNEFSNRIGISSSKISKVESGLQKISAEIVMAVNKEFGVSMEWLMGRVGYDGKIMFGVDFVPKIELEIKEKELQEERREKNKILEELLEYKSREIKELKAERRVEAQ